MYEKRHISYNDSCDDFNISGMWRFKQYICKLAEQKHRTLEINVNGLHKQGSLYPDERFWKIVSEYQIGTIINSDAHRVENLCAKKEYGHQIQKRYCLKQSAQDIIKKIL